MAHSSELECPQHGNMGIWATMHSVVESFFQLFIHDHSALQLTLSCDGIKNRVHHMSGIPQCYNTADTLTPPPPTKRVAGLGRERERGLFGTISIPSELSPNPLGLINKGFFVEPFMTRFSNTTKHPKPDNQPCLLKTNGKPCFLFNLLRTTFCIHHEREQLTMDPFHKTVMTRLTVISITNPQ